MIVLDFETYWSDDFSLSKMSTEEYIRSPEFEVIGLCIKVDDGPIDWITGTKEEIGEQLKAYHLEDATVCCHNYAFDGAIMTWLLGIKPKFIIDTLSLARGVIGLTQACNLKNLANYYGIGQKGEEVYNTKGKHRKDFSSEDMERFASYCKQDVNLTYLLLPKLLDGYPKSELELIDLTMRFFTEPVIKLDTALLEKHLAELKANKEALLAKVGLDSRDAFMSNFAFADLLRAEGVEPPTKISSTTGKESYAFAKTDDGMKALQNHPNERVQALAAARLGLKSTIHETRTQAFLDISKRGPMPILLSYYGSPGTGRYAANGEGTNPMNLPRGSALRYSMRAPDGYAVVACDSSNIEVRVEAWLAQEENLLKIFRENGDVYCDFGGKIYGHAINKHDNPEERRIAKVAVLGLGYSMGANKFQISLKNGGVIMDADKCKHVVDTYRTYYARIPAFWRECGDALRCMFEGYSKVLGTAKLKVDPEAKQIVLPNGMPIRYPELRRTEGEYGYEYEYKTKKFWKHAFSGSVAENCTQALARIIVCDQMLAIGKLLRKRNAKMNDGKIRQVAHFVHDECVVIVPKDEAENTLHMMELIMSKPPSWAEGLPLACEGSFGDTYGDAK